LKPNDSYAEPRVFETPTPSRDPNDVRRESYDRPQSKQKVILLFVVGLIRVDLSCLDCMLLSACDIYGNGGR